MVKKVRGDGDNEVDSDHGCWETITILVAIIVLLLLALIVEDHDNNDGPRQRVPNRCCCGSLVDNIIILRTSPLVGLTQYKYVEISSFCYTSKPTSECLTSSLGSPGCFSILRL